MDIGVWIFIGALAILLIAALDHALNVEMPEWPFRVWNFFSPEE